MDSATNGNGTPSGPQSSSFERLQVVLSRIGTALYVVDAKSQEYSFLSPMYTQLLGYTLDDVARLGGRRAFLAHMVVDDVEEKTHGFSRLRSADPADGLREQRVWCRHKDGQLRFVEDYWIPEYEEGQLARTYGVLRDITEQIETKNALKESENTYRTLFDGVADPILLFDKETNRIIDSNAAMAATFGYDADALREMTPIDLVAPGEMREAATRNINDESDTSAHAYDLLTSGGLPIPVEVHTAEVQHRGKPAWISIIRDITERKKAEELAKRHLTEIEAANEEIKQFAYIVSHDLRAPLVNLKGFSSELRVALEQIRPLAERAMAVFSDEEQRQCHAALDQDIPEALGFIDSSVDRMDGFINAVLKLSRIGRRVLSFRRVEPRPLVEEILRTLMHQQADHQAFVDVGDLPSIVADRTALEQIFGNLLANALLYLSPNRPGRIEVGGERGRWETTYWVRDNGRGISQDDAEKVFAPFRRAGRQDVPGEGMGLSYVHTMIRQHGGRIWFESEPDVGTTFLFTIPNDLTEHGGDHAE